MDPEPFATPDYIGSDPTYVHGQMDFHTQNGLGYYYLLIVILNLGFAFYNYHVSKKRGEAALWGLVAGVFLIHAAAYFSHLGWALPVSIKNGVDWLIGPVTYFVGATAAFAILLYFRKFFTEPIVAWSALNLFLLAAGWSMTDQEFRKIITKEDNVPIVMLIFVVPFFTWLAFRKAVLNDERIAKGEPPVEKLE